MTPLYDAIRAFSAQDPIRLHIPGHKGKPLPIPELTGVAALDFTELGPTGDLFHGGEPFDSAQRLWAEDFSMECCQFLTGGSTLGLHTALALCCRPGDRVLIDRGCHRAVYNALALLDLDPVYLPRPWWEEERLTSTISPEAVEKALTEHPEIKTICITSPSYSGLLCNIQRISHIVHRNGGRLIVDGAHGAHLPFLGVDAFSGADLVVCSAHKTLPALGQSSLLFANGFEPDDLGVRQFQPVLPHDDLHGRGPGLDGGGGETAVPPDSGADCRPAGAVSQSPGGRSGSHPADAERGRRPRPGPGAGGPGPLA